MSKGKDKKRIEFYMNLPYTIRIIPEKEGYFAEIEELPGCMTEGDTLEEVIENLREAQQLWIETALEIDREIPLPREKEEYSGRFVVRIPKYLHRRLAEQAKREGVSLNQLVVSLLSKSIEEKSYSEAAEQLRITVEELQRTVAAFQHALRQFKWQIRKEEFSMEYMGEGAVA